MTKEQLDSAFSGLQARIRDTDKKIEEIPIILHSEEELAAKCDEDVVNHPNHYETGKFECIEVMIETQGAYAVVDFCICNAFKYIYRWRNKNGIEDIKKAQWYLNKALELLEDKNVHSN